MTIHIKEDELSFSFEFDAIKFDGSQYYQKYFKNIQNNIKGIDILAVDGSVGYLIEIKDYTHPETKDLTSNKLIEAVINKVLSTLAAILPMKNNAVVSAEKNIANSFSKTAQIRVVLHIEIPPPRRTLKQSCFDLQNIQTQLGKRLKPIDAHAKVVSKENLKGLPWLVQ